MHSEQEHFENSEPHSHVFIIWDNKENTPAVEIWSLYSGDLEMQFNPRSHQKKKAVRFKLVHFK